MTHTTAAKPAEPATAAANFFLTDMWDLKEIYLQRALAI